MAVQNQPIDFLLHFLENRKIAPFFSRVKNCLSHRTIYEAKAAETDFFKKKVYTVFDVPGYLEGQTGQEKKEIKQLRTKMYKGYYINLKNYTGIDQYLHQNFSSKRRAQLRGYEKKLKIAFNTSFIIYYGAIDKPHYDFLFAAFRKMLERRSAQKGIVNDEIEHWKTYHEIAYPLLLKKQAYLSVIYHSDQPISICLNLVYDTIVYGCIKTHHIDYAKFSLGFIDLKKQLEWCFEHGFEIFDVLKGNYDYKSKWVDSEYYFEKYFIYDATSLKATAQAIASALKFRTIYGLAAVLRKWGVDTWIHRYRAYSYYKRKNNKLGNTKEDSIAVLDIAHIPKDAEQIDSQDSEFGFLLKVKNDLLYHTKATASDVSLLKSKHAINTFYIKHPEKNYVVKLKKKN